jgi:hypothetical protein
LSSAADVTCRYDPSKRCGGPADVPRQMRGRGFVGSRSPTATRLLGPARRGWRYTCQVTNAHYDNSDAAAISDLLAAVEDLLITYQALPDVEREQRWAADAHRITGELSRHLAIARTRLSPGFARTSGSRSI